MFAKDQRPEGLALAGIALEGYGQECGGQKGQLMGGFVLCGAGISFIRWRPGRLTSRRRASGGDVHLREITSEKVRWITEGSARRTWENLGEN